MKYAKVDQVSKKDKIEDTKVLIKKLEEENNKLKDELDSLWLMMDEMQKADIKNWTHLMEDLRKDVLTKSLMTTKKKADC
jgi:Asp-tRNA(Asn)/Glu-tRNA(Gln) amidotransferase C subunit